MQRNWTATGTEYSNTEEKKARFRNIVENLDWQQFGDQPVPMSQGLAIKQMIADFKLAKPTHFAYEVMDSTPAEVCVIAVRNEFSNGRAEIFCVDEGWQLVTVASDFYPKTA